MKSAISVLVGHGVSVSVSAGALYLLRGHGVWLQAVAVTAANWLLVVLCNGLIKMVNDSVAKTRKETLSRVSEDMKQWRAASRGEL